MIHQRFISILFKNNNIKNILLYHGLGTGKTASSILICNTLIELFNSDVKIFIIIKKSLREDTWMVDLRKFLIEFDKTFVNNIAIYEFDTKNSYNEMHADYIKSQQSFKNIVFIVDEAHNIISKMLKTMWKDQQVIQMTAKSKIKLQ